ncbi:Rv0804 family intramembrane glutamic endopeptidase [Mycobacterium avium]
MELRRPAAAGRGSHGAAGRDGCRAGGADAGTRVVAVRESMAGREPPAPAPDWLLLRIPVGTVWSEEAAFRAALTAAGSAAFGRRSAMLLQAIAFGLSHIADARAIGEPVAGTVAVTAVGGWFFGWLTDRCGSLAAPMLAHLAVNEAGAIAVLAVRRRSGRNAAPRI